MRTAAAGDGRPGRLSAADTTASPAAHTPAAPAPGLALFDLDGTITQRDTLLPYVAGYLARHPARLIRLPRLLPPLARCLLRGGDRGELKGALLAAALGGVSRADLEAWTEQFVAQLLEHGLRRDALGAIEAHRRQGDRLALLSASTELYVPAIGRALGFDDLLCTQLEWQGERLVGRLSGPNRRGAEKVRCLGELRTRYPGLPVTAYGDGAADLAHLELVDHGVLVNGSWRSRRAARRAGVACRTWH